MSSVSATLQLTCSTFSCILAYWVPAESITALWSWSSSNWWCCSLPFGQSRAASICPEHPRPLTSCSKYIMLKKTNKQKKETGYSLDFYYVQWQALCRMLGIQIWIVQSPSSQVSLLLQKKSAWKQRLITVVIRELCKRLLQKRDHLTLPGEFRQACPEEVKFELLLKVWIGICQHRGASLA